MYYLNSFQTNSTQYFQPKTIVENLIENTDFNNEQDVQKLNKIIDWISPIAVIYPYGEYLKERAEEQQKKALDDSIEYFEKRSHQISFKLPSEILGKITNPLILQKICHPKMFRHAWHMESSSWREQKMRQEIGFEAMFYSAIASNNVIGIKFALQNAISDAQLKNKNVEALSDILRWSSKQEREKSLTFLFTKGDFQQFDENQALKIFHFIKLFEACCRASMFLQNEKQLEIFNILNHSVSSIESNEFIDENQKLYKKLWKLSNSSMYAKAKERFEEGWLKSFANTFEKSIDRNISPLALWMLYGEHPWGSPINSTQIIRDFFCSSELESHSLNWIKDNNSFWNSISEKNIFEKIETFFASSSGYGSSVQMIDVFSSPLELALEQKNRQINDFFSPNYKDSDYKEKLNKFKTTIEQWIPILIQLAQNPDYIGFFQKIKEIQSNSNSFARQEIDKKTIEEIFPIAKERYKLISEFKTLSLLEQESLINKNDQTSKFFPVTNILHQNNSKLQNFFAKLLSFHNDDSANKWLKNHSITTEEVSIYLDLKNFNQLLNRLADKKNGIQNITKTEQKAIQKQIENYMLKCINGQTERNANENPKENLKTFLIYTTEWFYKKHNSNKKHVEDWFLNVLKNSMQNIEKESYDKNAFNEIKSTFEALFVKKQIDTSSIEISKPSLRL